MDLTHFGHACILVQTDTTRLLFDPGTLSADFESVDGLDAIVITHQHADHLDLARLPALLAANPTAVLLVDAGSAPLLAAQGLSARVVQPGDRVEVGGAVLDVVGGEHAVVHADIPVVPNAAFVLDGGLFYHPGDSYFVPVQDVDAFALPVSGPWLKLGEAIDFARAVEPRVAVPIHEAALSSTGTHYSMLTKLSPARTTFTPLARATATSL